jgi:hypothetical protein
MKLFCLFWICYACICCTGPQSAESTYDKTIHLVVTMDGNPTWSQSATATFAPLVAPAVTAIKMLTTP